MPLEAYIPPQGFEPGGDVVTGTPAEPVYEFDAAPVENSQKAVRSGGLFTAFAAKEPTITAPSTNPDQYVWDGEKSWRNLLEWVGQLLEQYQEENGGSIDWDDIANKPTGLITEEADPTVPAFVKSITQAQKDALVWFTSKFPRTGLTPGNVLVVAQNGDSVTHMPLSDMLVDIIPGLSGFMSGLVSPPSSLVVAQVGFDVRMSWTDIQRRAGYYAVEVRWRVNSGDWTDYVSINTLEFSELAHVWDQANIPPNVTHVGARLRYLRTDNTPSSWIEAQTTYNNTTPTVPETTYEIVGASVRWWSDGGQVLQTQYEVVPASVRWWTTETVTPPTTTPIAPNPITVARFSYNIIDVIVTDNNSGVDQYEYNFREKLTTTWYTLKADGSLNTNPTGPLLVTFADNISSRLMSLADTYFVGKQIEARVRTWVNGVASPWSLVVGEVGGGGSDFTTLAKSVRTAKINIIKDEDDLYSDTESDEDGIFDAYYYVNGRPYKDGSGNRKKFENEAFAPGLLIEVSKIFVNPAHFTSWTTLETMMYIAAISVGHPEYINSYAQQNFITD